MLKIEKMIYKKDREIKILLNGQYRGRKFAILSLGVHPTAYVELKKEEFKWVVASFRYDEVDDCFYIKECCDRLSDKNLNWSTFGYLVNLGRKYLELIKDVS